MIRLYSTTPRRFQPFLKTRSGAFFKTRDGKFLKLGGKRGN